MGNNRKMAHGHSCQLPCRSPAMSHNCNFFAGVECVRCTANRCCEDSHSASFSRVILQIEKPGMNIYQKHREVLKYKRVLRENMHLVIDYQGYHFHIVESLAGWTLKKLEPRFQGCCSLQTFHPAQECQHDRLNNSLYQQYQTVCREDDWYFSLRSKCLCWSKRCFALNM